MLAVDVQSKSGASGTRKRANENEVVAVGLQRGVEFESATTLAAAICTGGPRVYAWLSGYHARPVPQNRAAPKLSSQPGTPRPGRPPVVTHGAYPSVPRTSLPLTVIFAAERPVPSAGRR